MEKTVNKSAIFNIEISYLNNANIKEDADHLINKLPDYFFVIEASSTGKYHPSYALGEGGLVRHTKAAVRIAHELLNDPAFGEKYTSIEKDLMLLALLIHDGFKSGRIKEKYTKFDHPLIIAEVIEEEKEHLKMSDEERKLLIQMISSHMGPAPWNQSSYSNVVLPEPKTKYERFVHMCDYLASRKFLVVPFDDENKIVD